ncbi:MAG: beta-ketoacyl-[acyl-carrier-protein] synthase family protein [Phycisphaerales bacterium]
MSADPGSTAGVAITGVGLVVSLGLDAPTVWGAITAWRVGLGPMPAMESPLPPGSTGGQAPELPPGYRPELPREARYLRWAIEQALDGAGASGGRACKPERCAAILGTTLHGIRAGGRFLRTGRPEELRDFLAGSTLRAALWGLGVQGLAATTCSACSSSLGAVALGVTLLESGEADLVVAGGYDAIGEYVWAGFNSLRLVSPGFPRPFARDRDGMKIGEGYGIVILERAADAERRGAPIRAVIEGWGESADAHHLTKPHPEGRGAAMAMSEALDRAGCAPADVGMVAAHATSTPDNDASEYQALRALLGERLGHTPVVGFKSYLGHTLGGAGAVELILSVCAMEAGLVPPCANVAPDDVEFAGLRVAPPGGLRRPLARALNTSLGFGGANTCVVTARAQARRPTAREPAPAQDPPEAWITGVGVVLPGISDARILVERLAGTRGPLFERDADLAITDAQLSALLNVRRVRRLGENVKLLLAGALSAAGSAGLTPDDPLTRRAGAILASTHGSAGVCWDYYSQVVKEGVLAANPVLFAEGVPNAAAAHLSVSLGLRAGCQTIIGTRTAGLDALGLASLRVRTGAAGVVIVAASEELHATVRDVYRWAGLHRAGSDGGDGFVMLPGAAAIVVESSDSARRRGVRPLARVGAYRSAGLSPLGPVGSIARVLEGLGRVERVRPSGTGTWIDRAERLAIRRAARGAEVGGVSARIGELFSVGPLLEIVTALAGPAFERFAVIVTEFGDAASGVVIEPPSGDRPRA